MLVLIINDSHKGSNLSIYHSLLLCNTSYTENLKLHNDNSYPNTLLSLFHFIMILEINIQDYKLVLHLFC